MIAISIDLARQVHRERLRFARAGLLQSLDLAWKRAMEAGDTDAARAVAARQQALRDAPAAPEIAAAETPAALLDSIPDDDLRAAYERLLPRA
jgi:hypothetical protein